MCAVMRWARMGWGPGDCQRVPLCTPLRPLWESASGCISRCACRSARASPDRHTFVVDVAPRKRTRWQLGETCAVGRVHAATRRGPLSQWATRRRRCRSYLRVPAAHSFLLPPHACCASEHSRSTDTRAHPQRHPSHWRGSRPRRRCTRRVSAGPEPAACLLSRRRCRRRRPRRSRRRSSPCRTCRPRRH